MLASLLNLPKRRFSIAATSTLWIKPDSTMLDSEFKQLSSGPAAKNAPCAISTESIGGTRLLRQTRLAHQR